MHTLLNSGRGSRFDVFILVLTSLDEQVKQRVELHKVKRVQQAGMPRQQLTSSCDTGKTHVRRHRNKDTGTTSILLLSTKKSVTPNANALHDQNP